MNRDFQPYFLGAILLFITIRSIAAPLDSPSTTTNRWSTLIGDAERIGAESAETLYPQYFHEVPLTKRFQINVVSQDDEKTYGDLVWRSIQTTRIPTNLVGLQKKIEFIGKKLAANAHAISNTPAIDFRFRIANDSNFNATCFVGGEIIVNSGVLRVVKDDDELAFIVAHEIGHGLARHAGENYTQNLMMKKGLSATQFLAEFAAKNNHIQPNTITNILDGYKFASDLAVKLPHTRAQESEADHIGLLLMAKAGYRPEAAWELWERLAAPKHNSDPNLKSNISEYTSDHPLDQERADNIKIWLDE